MDNTGLIFEQERQQLQFSNNAGFYEAMTMINPLSLLDEKTDGFLVTNGTIQMMNMMGSNHQPISSTTFLNDKDYMAEHTSSERQISNIYNQNKRVVAFGQGAEFVYKVGRRLVNHNLVLTGLTNDNNQMFFNLFGGPAMLECKASELSNAKDISFDERPALVSQDEKDYSMGNHENLSYNQDAITGFICALARDYFGQQVDMSQVLSSNLNVFKNSNGFLYIGESVSTNVQFDANAFKARTAALLPGGMLTIQELNDDLPY